MPTYRGTSGEESVLVTTPEALSDEQLTGLVSGGLSIPGVTVERSGKSAAPTAPPPVMPPRDTAHGVDILRPGEAAQSPWKAGVAPMGDLPSWEGLKKKLPDLATDAALTMIPGVGFAKSAMRGAAATGAGVGTAGLLGESMEDQAVKSGLSSVAGEGVGGVARAGARAGLAGLSRATGTVGSWLGNKAGAGNTVVNFGEQAGNLVPAFKGATPRDTISRILDGSGVRQLGEEYGAAVEGVLKRHGDPSLTIPALAQLNIPSTLPASKINLFLKDRGRALFDPAGNMKRNKGSVTEGYWLDQAQDEFHKALTQHIPKDDLVGLVAAKDMYARGKMIQRLLSEGRETLTDAQLARLMDQGRLNEPLLERTFKRMGGKLKERFSAPGEYEGLEQAIRRGEKDPLAFSQEGRPGRVGVSRVGKMPIPHVSKPVAPVRIGRPEEVADAVARIFRLLGATGVQGAIDE